MAAYVPQAKPRGRLAEHPLRENLNGLFSILRRGGAWRRLMHDFPPWQRV